MPQVIVAADFDKYLHEISSYFENREPFVWVAVINGTDIIVPVDIDCVGSDGIAVTQSLQLRVGQTIPCRGLKLTSSDAGAVFVVGTGV